MLLLLVLCLLIALIAIGLLALRALHTLHGAMLDNFFAVNAKLHDLFDDSAQGHRRIRESIEELKPKKHHEPKPHKLGTILEHPESVLRPRPLRTGQIE